MEKAANKEEMDKEALEKLKISLLGGALFFVIANIVPPDKLALSLLLFNVICAILALFFLLREKN